MLQKNRRRLLLHQSNRLMLWLLMLSGHCRGLFPEMITRLQTIAFRKKYLIAVSVPNYIAGVAVKANIVNLALKFGWRKSFRTDTCTNSKTQSSNNCARWCNSNMIFPSHFIMLHSVLLIINIAPSMSTQEQYRATTAGVNRCKTLSIPTTHRPTAPFISNLHHSN